MKHSRTWGLLLAGACVGALVLVAWLSHPRSTDITPETPSPDPLPPPEVPNVTEAPAQPEVEPEPTRVLSGVVLDRESGEPIEGARIRLVRGNETIDLPKPVESGPDGTFEVRDLRGGRYMVLAHHPSFVPPFLEAARAAGDGSAGFWRVSVGVFWKQGEKAGWVVTLGHEPSAEVAARIEMARGVPIQGTVIDEHGAPVPEAVVGIRLPRALRAYFGALNEWRSGLRGLEITQADREGRFAVGCLLDGLAPLSLGAAQQGRVTRWRILREPMQSSTPVNLELLSPARLEGTLVDGEGWPLAGIDITATWDRTPGQYGIERPRIRHRTTDANGRFVFPHIHPGQVLLEAELTDKAPGSARALVEHIEAGEVRGGIELVVDERGVLRGILVDRDGAPVADVMLEALTVGEGADYERESFYAHTEEDGSFVFAVPSRATYDIRAGDDPEIRILCEGIAPPREGLVLAYDLPTKRKLEVRVLDPDGDAVHNFRVEAGGDATIWSDSAYAHGDGVAHVEVTGSPPWFVTVSKPRDKDGNHLAYHAPGALVAVADTRVVTVQLRERIVVAGRVVDSEAQPIPGARLFVEDDAGEFEVALRKDGRFEYYPRTSQAKRRQRVRVEAPAGFRRTTSHWRLGRGVFWDVRVPKGGVSLRGRVEIENEPRRIPSPLSLYVELGGLEDDPGHEVEWMRIEPDGSFALYALPEDAMATVGLYEPYLRASGLESVKDAIVTRVGDLDVRVPIRWIEPDMATGLVKGPGFDPAKPMDLELCVLPWHGRMQKRSPHHIPTHDIPGCWIGRLSPGAHRVALLDKRDSIRLVGVRHLVEAGDRNMDIHIDRRDGVISGAVDLEGIPAPQSIEVRVWHQNDTHFSFAEPVGRSGTFHIGRLWPSIEHVLQATITTKEGTYVATAQDATCGRHHELVPEPAHGLSGQVRLDDHGPDGLLVIAKQGMRVYATSIDPARGSFAFEALPGGEYEVVLVDPDGKRLGETITTKVPGEVVTLSDS